MPLSVVEELPRTAGIRISSTASRKRRHIRKKTVHRYLADVVTRQGFRQRVFTRPRPTTDISARSPSMIGRHAEMDRRGTALRSRRRAAEIHPGISIGRPRIARRSRRSFEPAVSVRLAPKQASRRNARGPLFSLPLSWRQRFGDRAHITGHQLYEIGLAFRPGFLKQSS